MTKYKLVTICSLFLFSCSSYADNFVIDGGLHFGGDRLVTIYNDNGTSQDVKAGQLLSVAGGYIFELSESMDMSVTFGLKVDSARINNGDDGKVSFTRYPLNVLLFHRTEAWRFGAGLTYHLNPELKIETSYYSDTYEFEDALGMLAEVRYYFTDRAFVGGRYTKIEYELNDGPYNYKFDGSSTGIVLGINI